MIRSIALFVLAGVAEIGGGYLIWLWLRSSRPWWFGLFGALILVLYGVIPTLQLNQLRSILVAPMPRMVECLLS
jgi:small multidrug resistance family-3 protein